jgi:hypothetical protein
METGKKVCFCDTGRQRAVSEEHDFLSFVRPDKYSQRKVNWREIVMDDDATAIELVIMVKELRDTGDP